MILSFFGKIDSSRFFLLILFFIDATTERQLRAIHILNEEYEIHFREQGTQLKALNLMVEGHPFKTLSRFVFETPPPMDSEPVPGDFSVCHFPQHKEFVILVRNAEKRARRDNTKAYYTWRGYRGFVSPNLPEITIPGMKMRLMNALRRISDISPSEKKVK